MTAPLTLLTTALGPIFAPASSPYLTGLLLWCLTRAPPTLRQRAEALLTRLAVPPARLPQLVRALRWLFVADVLLAANAGLSRLALDKWRVSGWGRKKEAAWKWEEEVAVVTGGSGGIGELVVKGLSERGVKVAVLDLKELPEGLQNNPNVRLFKCDITSSAALASTSTSIHSAFGAAPSILINNAGIVGVNPILTVPEPHLRAVFNVNLISNFLTAQAFVPAMIARGRGHVVTVASCASFVTVAGFVDYCASKAGAMVFHEGLAQELKHRCGEGGRGVACTSVHPNYVATPLVGPYEESLRREGVELLSREEVAGAIVRQVFSGKGAQIVLPRHLGWLAGLRGLPHWFQEVARDTTKRHVML